MKILYVTTIGITMNFFPDLIKRLLDDGHTVDIATNQKETAVSDCYSRMGCRTFQVDWSRSPLRKDNIKAISQLKKILIKGEYDIVHCHTPIASFCTRIACRGFRKKGLKVIYTAHGFHFYKGAPKKNWEVFYPIEYNCSRYTDTLITINGEDYALAKRKMKAKRIEYVPGVGVDTDKFKNTQIDRDAKREELNIPKDSMLILSVGEYNENKNHSLVIRAIKKLNNPKICYLIAGDGELNEYLKNLVRELNLENQVIVSGYRKDVAELYKASDLYILPSIREGLNVSLMEACASGLPCLAGKIRGNVDILNNNEAQLFNPSSVDELCEKLSKFIDCRDSGNIQSYQNDVSRFSSKEVNAKMMSIYNI